MEKVTVETLESSIVRIRAPSGEVVGAGFLIDHRTVATCAHVVARSLGLPDETTEPPNDEVHLDFPRVEPEQTYSARVIYWQAAKPPQNGGGDIAILQLENGPPSGARAISLFVAADCSGHTFEAYGFPAGRDFGVWARGEFIRRTASNWIHIEAVKSTGYRVGPGYSGGPVWDVKLQAPVGMVVLADQDPHVRAAFVIPTDVPKEAWPELGSRSVPGRLGNGPPFPVGRLLSFLFLAAVFLLLLSQMSSFRGPILIGVGVFVTLLPLVVWLTRNGLPVLQAARRSSQLRALAQRGQEARAGYFRIAPYEDCEEDQRLFTRADNAHKKVLDWLKASTEPILYLTGRSGTGKSSLLNAYVFPKLRQGTPLVRTVLLRGFEDPVDALGRQLLKPGVVWEQPLAAGTVAEGMDLVRSACAHLASRGERLLVVLDQFEELIILHDRDIERVRRTTRFLQDLIAGSDPGPTILLSLRSEYIGSLDRLDIPLLDPQTNWREITGISEGHARNFLANSASETVSAHLDELLVVACCHEDTRGFIRPITLNMLGSVLSRQSAPLPADEPGTLLVNDLRRLLNAPEVRDCAEPILARMVTEVGTKRPRSVQELTLETPFDAYTVEGCLLQLSTTGLVRRINRTHEITERVWEVSHDFVARLLDQILYAQPRLVMKWFLDRAAIASLIFYLLFGLYVYFAPEMAVQDLIARHRASVIRTEQEVTGFNFKVTSRRSALLDPT